MAENYGRMPVADMAEALGRSTDAVNYMISRLGLSEPRAEWSLDDIEYLKANLGVIPYADMAEHLGRSVRSVANKISNIRMGEMIADNLIEIESGIKMRPSKSATYRAMLSALEVGQSFTYPRSERAVLNNQRALFRERVFRAQRIDESTMRIWRML